MNSKKDTPANKMHEIIVAIEVGIEMSGGPGTALAPFAMIVLNIRNEI